MKISYDYDGTLIQPHIREQFEKDIKDGHDVCIITSRHEKLPINSFYNNDKLINIAKEFNIPVYFTNGKDKWEIIKELNIEQHYDDDELEIELIHENTKCKCIYVYYSPSMYKK